MFICQFCNKEYKSYCGLMQHEKFCHQNPNRISRIAWNKGLTKDIDERVRLRGISSGKTQKGRPGRPCSEETKQKISRSRKKFLEENPDKVPYLLNHTSKISYPEQYFLNCFQDIIENKEFQYHVYRYKLDFANPKEKLYLEIDGEQHYVDKRIVEHDIKRTSKLDSLGWTGYRIRWSKFQKLTDEEKLQKVLEVRSVMKWVS